VLYTSAFIAEIVRSASWRCTRARARPPWRSACRAPGDAARAAAPGAARDRAADDSQYLNIVKNSSLAIAIGYPDLVASDQRHDQPDGQAIENVLIIMAAYLSVSLSISGS